MSDIERRFPEDYTIAELHAIATRALAQDDQVRRFRDPRSVIEETADAAAK